MLEARVVVNVVKDFQNLINPLRENLSLP